MTPVGTGARPRPAGPAGAAGGRPRIDPRIRRRRAEVVRRQGRRRLRALLGALGTLAVLLVALVVLHSGLFAARRVTVVGSVHTPAAEIVEVAGLAGHPPLVDVGPSATTRLEALPWVERATVDVQWPGSVRITVVERRPVAAVRAAAGWAILGRDGRVLADTATPPADLPVVVDAPRPGRPGTTLRGLTGPLVVAATLPKAFADQVTQVVPASGGQVQLRLTTPLTVDLGTPTELRRKYEDVAAILSGASLADGDVIDVSAPAGPEVTSGSATG